MTRRQLDPLRPLTAAEHHHLLALSRRANAPAIQVARAKALLAVAAGLSYTDAAQAAGRKSGDAVAKLVSRFNHEGLAAVQPKVAAGRQPLYTPAQREAVLAAARRQPDPAQDGTATWSLTTLQQHLQANVSGLQQISTVTIWTIMREAGLRWQQSRSWCTTGKVQRKRKAGVVTVVDDAAAAKKN